MISIYFDSAAKHTLTTPYHKLLFYDDTCLSVLSSVFITNDFAELRGSPLVFDRPVSNVAARGRASPWMWDRESSESNGASGRNQDLPN